MCLLTGGGPGKTLRHPRSVGTVLRFRLQDSLSQLSISLMKSPLTLATSMFQPIVVNHGSRPLRQPSGGIALHVIPLGSWLWHYNRQTSATCTCPRTTVRHGAFLRHRLVVGKMWQCRIRGRILLLYKTAGMSSYQRTMEQRGTRPLRLMQPISLWQVHRVGNILWP